MAQVKQSPFSISYLPWAGLNEELTIGPVCFWPFSRFAEDKIADKRLRDYLRRFFRCFVDYHGRPVDSITICSLGNCDFREPTPAEMAAMRSAVDILIFVATAEGTRTNVCSAKPSVAPAAADRFTLECRRFRPDRNGIGVRAGSCLHYLTSMDDVRFSRPFALGGDLWRVNDRLLRGFGRALEGHGTHAIDERLFRSLEWFRLAHAEADAVSPFTKLVLMSIAFEVLLDFPEQGKKRYFSKYINRRLGRPDSFQEDRPIGKEKSRVASLAAWWASDFYELRSRIVHGDRVTYEDVGYKEWITHLMVADLVMLELVTRVLCQNQCIVVEECLCDEIASFADLRSSANRSVIEHLLPTFLGLDYDPVHEALGWIPSLMERKRLREQKLQE